MGICNCTGQCKITGKCAASEDNLKYLTGVLTTSVGTCSCDCHKVWSGLTPPICRCNCSSIRAVTYIHPIEQTVYISEYNELKEENEMLQEENKGLYYQNAERAVEIFKLRSEVDSYKDYTDSFKSTFEKLKYEKGKLKLENEKLRAEVELLKADNKSLSDLNDSFMIRSDQFINALAELQKSYEKTFSEKLAYAEENEMLKAELKEIADSAIEQAKKDGFEIGKLKGEAFRKPHKCPVCDGDGKKLAMNNSACVNTSFGTIAGIYIDSAGRVYDSCKSCNGKGIVWEN